VADFGALGCSAVATSSALVGGAACASETIEECDSVGFAGSDGASFAMHPVEQQSSGQCSMTLMAIPSSGFQQMDNFGYTYIPIMQQAPQWGDACDYGQNQPYAQAYQAPGQYWGA